MEAHANAPDCEKQEDCANYVDACCGTAEPTSRGRGDPHHICWSKYSSRYLDEDGLYYTFTCMSEKQQYQEIVVVKPADVPMSWYDDTMWVDSLIKAQYTCGTFPIIGLPFYLIMGMVVFVHYVYKMFWSLDIILEDAEVVEEGQPGGDDWTINNWFLFPVRRGILFSMFATIGSIGNLLVPINFIVVPVIGLLAWINNFY